MSLWAYAGVQGDKQNRITVTVDGATGLENNRGFGESSEYTYKVSGDVDHVFTVEVTAHDSEQCSSKEEGIEVPACVKEQPPAEEPPAEESSSVAAPPTTTEAPVVPIADEEEPPANTGADIAIPLVIGVVLLGGGAALLIAQRKRAARDRVRTGGPRFPRRGGDRGLPASCGSTWISRPVPRSREWLPGTRHGAGAGRRRAWVDAAWVSGRAPAPGSRCSPSRCRRRRSTGPGC